MASTSELRVITTLLSNTMDQIAPKVSDQVHEARPLTWYMTRLGRGPDLGMGKGIHPYTGGAKIKFTIRNLKNPNSKWYSRYETLTVAPTEEETDGIDVMRNLSSTASISGQEVDENRGPARIREMIREKVDGLIMGLAEDYETALVQGQVGGAGAPQFQRFLPVPQGPNPLGFLIQKSFNNADLVHEVNQVNETYWRNRVLLSAPAASFAALRREQFRLYRQCARGSTPDFPDFGVSDPAYYEVTEAAMTINQRFPPFARGEVQSAGFEAIMIKNMTLFSSDFFPNFGATAADTVSLVQNEASAGALFLNTRAYELWVSDRVNMQMSAWIEPYNQDAIHGKMLHRVQAVVRERRKLGLHHNVPASTLTA